MLCRGSLDAAANDSGAEDEDSLDAASEDTESQDWDMICAKDVFCMIFLWYASFEADAVSVNFVLVFLVRMKVLRDVI